MSRWWRAEDTSIDHPKLLRLSDAMHRAWYTLMCIASANGGALPPVADIALRLRIKPSKVAEWMTLLVKAELFDNCDGTFVPHNWENRQYKSDVTDPTAAQRMKRYRENKRNDRNAAVTVIRPETEADTEQSTADAVTLQNEISERWNLTDVGRVPIWLEKGYSETLILETIGSIMARGLKITSAAYFDAPLKDAHANRVPSPSERSPVDYDAVVATWAKTGVWSRWAGPDPSSPACKASAEHFAKHGVDRHGTKLAR
jgi:hypothetical protein